MGRESPAVDGAGGGALRQAGIRVLFRHLQQWLRSAFGPQAESERRQYDRADVDVDVLVVHGESRFTARISDVSISGALLACGRDLLPGSAIELRLPDFAMAVPARVVRSRGRMSGIRFDDPNHGVMVAGWSRGTSDAAPGAAGRRVAVGP